MFKRTSKIYLTTIILAVLIGLGGAFFVKTVSQAQASSLLDNQSGILNTIGGEAQYIEKLKPGDTKPVSAEQARTDMANKIGNILGAFLAGLGVVFLAYMVYSGYQWMSSGGEEEKVTKARTRIINSVIGLAIVALSYGVTSAVLGVLNYNASSQVPNTGTNIIKCTDDDKTANPKPDIYTVSCKKSDLKTPSTPCGAEYVEVKVANQYCKDINKDNICCMGPNSKYK